MSNVHRTMGEEEEKEAENRFQRLPDDVVVNIFDKVPDVKCLCVDCFKNANRWLETLACAVPAYPMLRSITITDSKNNGVKLCLDGEKLVEYRNTLEISPPVWTLGDMRIGCVPVLELPISGYVMKGVIVVTMNIFGFDETAQLDAFAEEKGVFLEAMVQILEKHKGIIRPLF